MKQKPISGLEQQVMDIVWNNKECSVRSVYKKLQRTKPIAYTTVATILQRLEIKGIVTKQDDEKAHVYKPKVSKEAYSKSLATGFLEKFISSFGNLAISSFAESIEKLPKEKKEYFLKLLDEHEHTK